MNISDNENHINNLNNAVIYMHSYILIMFYILGNIGNILSAWVFMKKSWRKNVCVFYFKVCLLLNTSYLNSTVLGAIFNFGFQIYLQNSSVLLCKLLYYISFLLSTLPPTVLILASIDRLLLSSQNITTRLYSSKRLAYFSISISTFFWVVFNLHILIKITIHEIEPSNFVCSFTLPQSYYYFVTYSLGIINGIFCLLMIVLCVFAFKNVRLIRVRSRGKRHELRTMKKKDFQLLRCLFAQDIIFITSSMLVIIYYLYAAVSKNQVRTNLDLAILNFVDRFVTFLFNISYSTNFFVFITLSKAFRQEMKCLIYRLIGKDLMPTRGEEENIKQENMIGKDNIELNVVSTIVLPH